MVTPPSCPGLTVDILVDGQPLQEYDAIDEGPVPPNTVTKYIEARSGANFAVRARFSDGFRFPTGNVRLQTTLDLQHERKSTIHAHKLFRPEGKVNDGYTCRIGGKTDALYKYQFVALDLVEDDDLGGRHTSQKDIQAIGIITAQLQFVCGSRPVQPDIKIPHRKVFSGLGEKAFKGDPKSHCGGLDLAVPHKSRWVQHEDVGDGPFVTVNFKYRSLDVLRALHIVPREPTPLPLEDRPIEELNLEETREVLRLYRVRHAAALKIKTEASSKRSRSGATETAGEDDVVIVEGPSRKRRRAGNSEVIVLD